MATITSDTFLDGGTARTAGETWACNGGVLTIRTDTRWHANAPASMTGSLGAITISTTLGGGVMIDARNVRWLAFNSGSSTVPAIGTTVSQGGVSGYLLGVWGDLNEAPRTVGSAMPATGFLKFREVTGGAFSAGALTGISASATGADVTGWIEVVQRQAVANTVPKLGYFRTRGDWFYLDNTNGSAGQVIQIPTNGGGSDTHVPAVWIETGAGSDEFEPWPAVLATWFNNTNLSTDERSKFVQTIGNGQIRIGNDGTNNAGYVPESGCRVRIPNIIGRQSASGTDASNQVPHATLATRPNFTTTSGGRIDFEYFINDWYHLFASPYSVRVIHSATFDIHTTSNEGIATELEDYVTGAYTAATISLTAVNNSIGGTITNCRFTRPDAATSGHSISFTGCNNYTLTNVRSGIIQYARSTGNINFSICSNITINNMTIYCANLALSTVTDSVITNLSYIDRIIGVTNATTAKYAIVVNTGSNRILVDGVNFGPVADVSPYAGIFNIVNSQNVRFQNVGSFDSPLPSYAAAAPAYIFVDNGNNFGIAVRRCYVETIRTGLYFTANSSRDFTIQDCSANIGAIRTLAWDGIAKGVRAVSNSVSGSSSVYGTHWFDMFTSDTAGRVWLAFNEPTDVTASQYTAVSLGTNAGFTSFTSISMPNIGDEVIFEMPYFAIGHTGFSNTAAVITGTNTGNFTYQYQIDTGSGFGSYSTLNGANLSAEVVNPSIGFKLKIRVVVTAASLTNALSFIRVTTTSTLTAQQTNQYPITFVLSGTITGYAGDGSGIAVDFFRADTKTNIGSAISTTGGAYNFSWVRGDIPLYGVARQSGTRVGRSDNLYPVPLQPLLLDRYQGALAAYSLRKLRESYDGPCIRVRRSSDSTEKDIGFMFDSFTTSYVMDAVDLLSFVGSGSGFVTVWYDQSFNEADAIQTSTALQPSIVSSGVINAESGSYGIRWDSAQSYYMTIPELVSVLGVNHCFLGRVHPYTTTGGAGQISYRIYTRIISGSSRGTLGIETNQLVTAVSGGTISSSTSITNNTTVKVASTFGGSTNSVIRDTVSDTVAAGISAGSLTEVLLGVGPTSARYFDGLFMDAIFYPQYRTPAKLIEMMDVI